MLLAHHYKLILLLSLIELAVFFKWCWLIYFKCRRFHDLFDFDEKKRSCREQLSRHNARRRKHQPEALQSSQSVLSSRCGNTYFSIVLQFISVSACYLCLGVKAEKMKCGNIRPCYAYLSWQLTLLNEKCFKTWHA